MQISITFKTKLGEHNRKEDFEPSGIKKWYTFNTTESVEEDCFQWTTRPGYS